MKRILHFVIAGLIVVLSGCSTLQVSSDYDPAYDFSGLRSVAILYPASSDGVIGLAQQRFQRAIAQTLREKGFQIVQNRDQADIYILFHLNVTERKQIVTDYQTVGLYPYYPAWYGYPAMVPVTEEYSWQEGKFVVDAVDPKTRRVVWRGVAVDRLKDFKTPRERIEYIRKVVRRIFQNFPPQSNQ